MRIDEIWYASADRAKSSLRMCSYDDKGKLIIEDAALVFQGEQINIKIKNIINIYTKTQAFKWKTWLLILVIAIPIYRLFYIYMWSVPKFIKLFFAIVCVSSIFVGFMFGFVMKWVVIEGKDDEDNIVKYYFYDGKKNGWSGIFGGTNKLKTIINRTLSHGV